MAITIHPLSINYFLCASVIPEARRQNDSLFMDTYLESLNSSLGRFGYTGVRLDRASLDNETERLFFVKTFATLLVYAFTTYKNENGMDLEKVLQSEGNDGMQMDVFNCSYRHQLGEDIKLIAEKLTVICTS